MLKNWRVWAFRLVVLELASVLAFIGVLLLGETRRLTLLTMYMPRQPLLLAVIAGAILAWRAKRRWRELVAAHVVVGLIVLFPVMGLSLHTGTTLEKPIKVASYNVWYGRAGRDRLIEELAALPDDVILIQAAYGSLGEKLSKRLPDRIVKQDSVEFVIVSKFPIRKVEEMPDQSNDVPAMATKFIVDTPQGALRIFSVHAWSPRHALGGADDARVNIAAREWQLGSVVTAARNDPPPFLIIGDTNLPAMSAVKSHTIGDLTDAWDTVGFGFGYTFPYNHPWMRIDRAMGTGIKFGSMRVMPEGASDHRAIEVELELTNPE